MIQYQCPRCTTMLQSEDGQAGAVVMCPKCRQRVQVPVQAIHVIARHVPSQPGASRAITIGACGIASLLLAFFVIVVCAPYYFWPHYLVSLVPNILATLFALAMWRASARHLDDCRLGKISLDGRGLAVAGMVCAIVATIVDGIAMAIRVLPLLTLIGRG